MDDNRLNGTWRLIRSVEAGREGASPADTVLVIEGASFERRTFDAVYKRTILLDMSVVPHRIDLYITNEPGKGQTFLGIYKLEGDTLFIAHALDRMPRPLAFESTRENGQILSVSRKELR